MAALLLGGCDPGALLKVVFEKLFSEAIRRVGSLWEINDGILKLESTLQKIKSMVANAEELVVSAEGRFENNEESNLKKWIDKARTAENEVLDLKDELELAHVKREKQICILNYLIPEFVCNLADSSNIQDIQKKLDSILRLADNYDLKKSEINVKQSQRRETSSILDDEVVIGRDDVKAQVIEMLMSESAEDELYGVIPITGIGGVGKTALAQFIYNSEDIIKHFQLKAWVCVSDDFDEKKLTKEIIKSISTQSKRETEEKKFDYFGDDNWDVLQAKLKELITGKRFLLVLDDVGTEKAEKWQNFKKPFRFGHKGSKILVTTRNGTVAKMVNNKMKPIELEGLYDRDFWTLFKRVAFAGSSSSENPSLEAIGRDIIKKLKGSPLAAKTIGRLLNDDLNVTRWNEILESELWELPQNENDIMPALRLSYQKLPECLKPCFAFFSLFQKDHVFDGDKLVQMWSAHSWIKNQGKKLMEDVGKEYLNALLGRSMIESYKGETVAKNYYGYQKESYKMHDLIHDLAMWVSEDEYFYVKSESDLPKIPPTVRHLSVYCSDITQPKMLYQYFNNLRTLIVSSGSCQLDLHVIFSEAKKLRLLKVRNTSSSEVPDSIKQLSHLRYLDLNSNQIRSLPDSFCTLHFLQVLVLKYCPLRKLPMGFNTLVNLRHLILPHNHFTGSDVTGVGNLRLLQKLRFEVSNAMGHTITELKNMNKLRKLYVSNLERVRSKENAMEGNLKGKDHLHLLELCWNNDEGSSSSNVNEDVFEGLQPPKNIIVLRITFYDGIRSPSWMENQSLSSIRHIEIIECKYWNIDVSFGHMPHLVSLRIGGMKAVQQLGPKFFGEGEVKGFPSLEFLAFYSLENWEEWRMSPDNHNTQIFPRLHTLKILVCSKLKGIPFQIPPTVSILELYCCPNLAPISMLLPSITDLTVKRCGEVCNSFSTTHLEGLASLREARIKDCPNLKSLSPSLKALQILKLNNCPDLKLESWLQHLTCLRSLVIRYCPKAVESLLKEQIVLPSSLEDCLEITGGFSPGLSANYDIDAALPTCMKNLSSLERFCIGGTHDVSLTSWIQNLPLLSELEMKNCQELESLDFQSHINLKYLFITNCPKLSVVSTFPSQLELFIMVEVSMVQLKEWLILLSNTSSVLKGLAISECPELISFDVDMEDALLKLTKLSWLKLNNCRFCQSLPTRLNNFPSLRRMVILRCPNIQSLPENGLPSSLRLLHIGNCPMLKEQCKIEGRDWHKISHIKDIWIDWGRIRWNSKIPEGRSGRMEEIRMRNR